MTEIHPLTEAQEAQLQQMRDRARAQGFDVRLSQDASRVETFDPSTDEVMFDRPITVLTDSRCEDQ